MAHQGQGVVIASQKAMNAVFFNSGVGPPRSGAFAAQSPSHLVQRDVSIVLPARLAGEFKGRGQRGDAAAQNRDFPGCARRELGGCGSVWQGRRLSG